MAWPFWLARFGPALGKIMWERSKKLLGSALTKWEYKRIGLQIMRQAKKNKWSAKRIQEEVEKYYNEIKNGKNWQTDVKDLQPDDFVELLWESPRPDLAEELTYEKEGEGILYGSWSKEDLVDWVRHSWDDFKVKGDIIEGHVDGQFVRARIRKNPEEGASQIDELQRADAFDPSDYSPHELMEMDDLDPRKLMNMEDEDMTPLQRQAWKKQQEENVKGWQNIFREMEEEGKGKIEKLPKDKTDKSNWTWREDQEEAKRLEDIRNKPEGKDILRSDIVDEFKDLDDYLRADTDDPVLREFKNELLRSRMESRNDENLARANLQKSSEQFRKSMQDLPASEQYKGSRDQVLKHLMNTPVAATALVGTTASLVHKNKSKKKGN